VVSTFTDVTRHVLAEQELRNLNEGLESRVQRRTVELQRARDEAERASLAKSQFLSRMSHELRTPLNAMLGFAQLLSFSREPLRDSELEKVRQIEHAGWHLLDLINDVLDLSRIEAGEMSTSIEPVLVAELVSETVQMLSTQAAQQRVRLIEQHGAHLWARADRKRLKQVLNNLLSNAIKYNQPGGSVTLEVSAAEHQQLRVTVTDTGRGMNAQQLANLYQPFVRFEQGNELTAGTGIGLVITKRLVELMGGQITVESEPGVGTRFSVSLVASAASPFSAPMEVPVLAMEPPASYAAPAGVSRRLLYIEDNPINAELVRSMLLQQRPEFDLRIAADGYAGLEMVQLHRPHLVLIDIGLPGIDGLEVCRRLRADPANQGMPLIAFSANAMPADVRDAQAAGFDAYLTKPIDLPELLEHIDRLLNEQAFSASAFGELPAPL
jgi:CheY-like chemotaxis protein